MTLREIAEKLVGASDRSNEQSDEDDADEPEGPPSHICQSCGELYHSDPDIEIEECRSCGGVKVERTAAAEA